MLTLEEKIKLYIAGVSKGISEKSGCSDGEKERTNDLINQFFSMNDEDFTKYCDWPLARLVAYGG
jgi:hypothetical protein